MMIRSLWFALLGAVLTCTAPVHAAGQALHPAPVAHPSDLAYAVESQRMQIGPTRSAAVATGWRTPSADADARVLRPLTAPEEKQRFSFRGTLIGAAVGAGLAFAVIAVVCDNVCWSHPENPKVFGVGIGLGALVGLSADIDRYERGKEREKDPEPEDD